jgi:hypothetical protein
MRVSGVALLRKELQGQDGCGCGVLSSPRVGDGQGLYLPFQEGLQRILRRTDRFLEAFMGFLQKQEKAFRELSFTTLFGTANLHLESSTRTPLSLTSFHKD